MNMQCFTFQRVSSMTMTFRNQHTLLTSTWSFVSRNADMIRVRASLARRKENELCCGVWSVGWAAGCHTSQKWFRTSRATYRSNYGLVMASRLLRIRTWSAEDDTWHLWHRLCFLHHANKLLPSGDIPEGCACWLSLQRCLFKQAHRMWCQRYERSAGRLGIDSRLLPASINDCDCTWKLSQILLHTVVL